jgi:hypothetical protein
MGLLCLAFVGAVERTLDVGRVAVAFRFVFQGYSRDQI